MTVHFNCEGCGVEVHAIGIDRVPAHGFCSTCDWLNTYKDQAFDRKEFWEIYDRIVKEHRGDASKDDRELSEAAPKDGRD